jgi:hypothetical protein
MRRPPFSFFRFWWEFVIGDDWRIAAGVVGVLALGGIAVRAQTASAPTLSVLVAAGLSLVASLSIVLPGLRQARERHAQSS